MRTPPGLAALLAALLIPLSAHAAAPAPATITVKGSDTVGGELGPAIAKAFMASHPGVIIHWEALGSSTAFPGLLDGTAQLGASSRSVNAKELALARDAGVELKEWVLGYDGIAVVVHPSNPIRQLTLEQLSGLFTGKIADWAALGSTKGAVRVIGRPTYSGTHAFFKEKVLRLGKKDGAEEYAPRTAFLEKTEEIVHAVATDPAAIAYVGMGFLKPSVAAVAVAPAEGKPFVGASIETVRAGTYPVYRPLLLYTRGEPSGELRALLQFALGAEGRRLVAAHDFTPSDVSAAPGKAATDAAPAPAPAAAKVFRVLFAFGEVTPGADGQAALAQAAAAAREAPAGRVRLVGHADAVGSPEANRKVAAARVQAVSDRLRRLGVAADRLLVEVRGADEPRATNASAAGRRENRRVDVEVLPPRHAP